MNVTKKWVELYDEERALGVLFSEIEAMLDELSEKRNEIHARRWQTIMAMHNLEHGEGD